MFILINYEIHEILAYLYVVLTICRDYTIKPVSRVVDDQKYWTIWALYISPQNNHVNLLTRKNQIVNHLIKPYFLMVVTCKKLTPFILWICSHLIKNKTTILVSCGSSVWKSSSSLLYFLVIIIIRVQYENMFRSKLIKHRIILHVPF